jgi:hypothetical protein
MIGGLLGFALMTAFWPGIAAAAVLPRWIVGALMMLAFVSSPRLAMTCVHWTGLVLCTFLIATLAWAPSWDGGDVALCLVIMAAAFAWASTLDDVSPFVIGAAAGIAVNSALVIAQQFTALPLPFYARPAGLFYNPNLLAEAASAVIVAVAALRLWWLAALLLPALLLPGTRGALFAAAACLVLLVDWRYNDWKLRLLVGCVAFIALIVFVRQGVNDSIHIRLDYWRDGLAALNWQGHGIGSIWTTFPQFAHFTHVEVKDVRPEHLHNELLELAYEGGVGAVVLALVFVVALADAAYKNPLALVLLALAIMSVTEMPLREPATALFGAVIAGFVAGRSRNDADGADLGGNELRDSGQLHPQPRPGELRRSKRKARYGAKIPAGG